MPLPAAWDQKILQTHPGEPVQPSFPFHARPSRPDSALTVPGWRGPPPLYQDDQRNSISGDKYVLSAQYGKPFPSGRPRHDDRPPQDRTSQLPSTNHPVQHKHPPDERSEERRVGKESVSTCKPR